LKSHVIRSERDVPLNKTNMLGKRKFFYSTERVGNKQDFGVAERGGRGTNKTLALPSVANRVFTSPAGRFLNTSIPEAGGGVVRYQLKLIF